jgi:pyroglutamyl-peptidase
MSTPGFNSVHFRAGVRLEPIFSAVRRGSVGGGTRLMLVGFGPYRGRQVNGSESLVRALAATPPACEQVLTMVVPVAWGAIEELVVPELLRFRPNLVLGLGEGGKEHVALERTARNVRSGQDERGATPPNRWIEMDGPDVLYSRLTFQSPRPRKRQGMPVVFSADAGEYLCNNALYRFLDSPAKGAGFVHVPPQGEDSVEAYVARFLPLLRGLIEENDVARLTPAPPSVQVSRAALR